MTYSIQGQGGGQPTKYLPRYNKLAAQVCLLGATDDQLAECLEVSVSTVNNWKIEHPKFLESIRKSKLQADAGVAASLYKRAIGYKITEKKVEKAGDGDKEEIIKTTTTTKHLAGDVVAQTFWLKNRQPKLWRDRHEQVISAGENVEFNMTFSASSDQED